MDLESRTQSAMIQTPLLLPSNQTKANTEDNKRLILPFTLDNRSLLEDYITSITEIRENAHLLLSQPVQIIDLQSIASSSYSATKIVYVLQGEVAHVSTQGLLLSDQSTTCHILAIHSTSYRIHSSVTDDEHSTAKVIGSLCHLDAPHIYKSCIDKIIQTHFDSHRTKGDDYTPLKISFTFHLMGGYLDPQGLSKDISNDILGTLIEMTIHWDKMIQSHSHNLSIQWKLATCAITSLNTISIMNNTSPSQKVLSPRGRGLALDVSSGKVFLVKMSSDSLYCDSIVPMYILRHTRLWFQKQSHPLTLIHTIDDDDLLNISPFQFFPSSRTAFLLSLEKDPPQLLKYTSTSPECEETEYCDHVIQTLRFIHEVSSSSVFGIQQGRVKGLQYQWMSGAWKRIMKGIVVRRF